jgi:hypothetical protein
MEKVEEIATNFVNGNISDVKKAFNEMEPLEAANVAVGVYLYLRNDVESAGEAGAFRNLLRKWLV